MTAPLSEQEIAEGERLLATKNASGGLIWFAMNADKLITTIRADRARIAELQDELSRVLSDWNDLVRAIGSPTNGGAVAHAASIVRQLAERTRERDRWKEQSDDWQKRGWEAGQAADKAEAELAAAVRRAEAAERDAERLDYLLRSFYSVDNAWIASFCFDLHKDGMRAAIDEDMRSKGKKS